MRLLGYEPIQSKQPTEFQAFILRALREMTIREVAVAAQTSLPTVQRWASGQSAPVDSFKKHIINHLMPEVTRREDEIYDKYFGGKKKS